MRSRHIGFMYVWPLDSQACHLPSHHFRQHPPPTALRLQRGQYPHQADLGLSKCADQSLWVDVETEAREGKNLSKAMQQVQVRGSGGDLHYLETKEGEKGLMGLGEREADDQTNLELRLKA